MTDAVQSLKTLARNAELQLIEKANGHFIIVGGVVVVHYWPLSRRQTVYVEGSPIGNHYATPKQAINLANKGQK